MTGTGPMHIISDGYHSLPYGLLWQKKNYRVEYKKQAESVQVKYILMRVPIENGSGFINRVSDFTKLSAAYRHDVELFYFILFQNYRQLFLHHR